MKEMHCYISMANPFHIDYIVCDVFRSNISRAYFCISLPTLLSIDMQHVGQQY